MTLDEYLALTQEDRQALPEEQQCECDFWAGIVQDALDDHIGEVNEMVRPVNVAAVGYRTLKAQYPQLFPERDGYKFVWRINGEIVRTEEARNIYAGQLYNIKRDLAIEHGVKVEEITMEFQRPEIQGRPKL